MHFLLQQTREAFLLLLVQLLIAPHECKKILTVIVSQDILRDLQDVLIDLLNNPSEGTSLLEVALTQFETQRVHILTEQLLEIVVVEESLRKRLYVYHG